MATTVIIIIIYNVHAAETGIIQNIDTGIHNNTCGFYIEVTTKAGKSCL